MLSYPKKILLLSLMVLGSQSCVLPSEFDEVSNACESNESRFDVATRTQFCSGSYSSRRINVESNAITENATSFVDLKSDWMSKLDVGVTGAVTLQIFKQDDTGTFRQQCVDDCQTSFRIDSNTVNISSAVVGGMSEGVDPKDARLLMVNNDVELRFLKIGVNPLGEDQRGTEDGAANDWIVLEPFSDIEEIEVREEANLFCDSKDIIPRYTDLDTFTSTPSDTGVTRQYFIAAMNCAVIVYGLQGDVPVPLIVMNINAFDVVIDAEQDRILLAGGLDGLKIESLSRLRDRADQMFDHFNADAEASDDTMVSTQTSKSPSLDDVMFEVPDLSTESFLNISKLSVSGERVFYINEAVLDVAGDPSSRSYLVAGDLRDGYLENKVSVLLPESLIETDEVEESWDLVGIRDSYFAVLRNSRFQTDRGQAESSQIFLYDAPVGNKPVEFMKGVISPTSRVDALFEREGELLISLGETLLAYDISITGDSLP